MLDPKGPLAAALRFLAYPLLLLLAVGPVAHAITAGLPLERLLPLVRLSDVVGLSHRIERAGRPLDVIPLPHPSGVSTWHRVEPGLSLLDEALGLIRAHPAWRQAMSG